MFSYKKNFFEDLRPILYLGRQLKKIRSLIRFESNVIEDYYVNISLNHRKNNLKNGIKLIILFTYGSLLLNHIFSKGTIMTVTLFTGILTLLLGFYLSTMFINSNQRVRSLTWVTMLILYLINILNFNFLVGLMEINFTPTIQFTMLMFSNLPIKMNRAILLSSISIALVIIAGVSKFQYKWFLKLNRSDGNTEDLKEVINLLPIFDPKIKVIRYVSAVIILGFGIISLSLYTHIINNIRRRSAFIKFGRTIEIKKQLKNIIKTQIMWTDVIMPQDIKQEYWKHYDEIKVNKWVYIKAYDNVTILFANIVDFTKLTSSKNAAEVVLFLNELFNEFDDMSKLTNCEKLGTFGDCYYCIAGCPTPRSDHAVCCIEMGLGICRIVDSYNADQSAKVLMRVGLHTGRVNAAIIGKERFRFDVFSKDVIIANSMESTGRPGFVHISQTVYDSVSYFYDVQAGEDFEIKLEEKYGIGGMQLKSSFIKTYYVNPMTAKLHVSKETPINVSSISISTANKKTSSSSSTFTTTALKQQKRSTSIKKALFNQISKDLEFVEGISHSFVKKNVSATDLPINLFTMSYDDKELEWHFQKDAYSYSRVHSFDSLNLAPLIDSCSTLIYSICIYVSIVILHPSLSFVDYLLIFFNIFLFLLINLTHLWSCFVVQSEINEPLLQWIYFYFASSLGRSLHYIFCVSAPLATVLCLMYDCEKINGEYIYTVNFFILIFFSILIIPVYTSAPYFLKVILCVIHFSIAVFSVTRGTCMPHRLLHSYKHYSCMGQQNFTDVTFYQMIRYQCGFQMIITFVLAIFIIREIERNVRLWFYVSREAEIKRDETAWVMLNLETLLYNVIPKYVFVNLKIHITSHIEISSFNYATSIPNAGVIFACIDNFFSSYYREDYKGGENSLKLLHQIICEFDDLLKKSKYKDVEKIRTINDCYMVASGLNIEEIKKNPSETEHLNELMYFCFDLIQTLEKFNDNYIIGSDKFKIKIGYNFGPLTAGIIGFSKPMYDVWGDTVKISSRMFYTSNPGSIQVPDYVQSELKSRFLFKYRGLVKVKGKGEMKTYFCIRPYEYHELNFGKLVQPSTYGRHIQEPLSVQENRLSLQRGRCLEFADLLMSIKKFSEDSDEETNTTFSNKSVSSAITINDVPLSSYKSKDTAENAQKTSKKQRFIKFIE